MPYERYPRNDNGSGVEHFEIAQFIPIIVH